MPVKIPRTLPASQVLKKENIFVMDESRASSQDIRPLKIVILNLMPTKEVTETQLLRLIGNSPLQIEVVLLRTASHKSKNTAQEHLSTFYKTFEDIKDQKFDGLIITGAPVEKLEFDEVTYWQELESIMKWSQTNVFSNMHICWAAQAGMYFHYGVPKIAYRKKLFGIFEHKILKKHEPLLRGFDDRFFCPHSRYTGVSRNKVEACDKLELLSYSKDAGVSIITSKDHKNVFVTGHFEYDRDTLDKEYKRDLKAGLDTDIPQNYYYKDDPKEKPMVTWHAHANLLFTNWLNYYIYQDTPFDINEIN